MSGVGERQSLNGGDTIVFISFSGTGAVKKSGALTVNHKADFL